ncbi:P-type ATPase [Mortierella sp. GBA30]|nr:P-type ATPase [Mortierella sp. GBA30]
MRNIKTSPGEIRRNYIQQYLNQFLRRVHPDLFLSHPKEQLRNSASLQDLLPLVSHEKHKDKNSPRTVPTNSSAYDTPIKKLVFYFRPKQNAISTGTGGRPRDGATGLGSDTATPLRSVEHMLPVIDLRTTVTNSSGRTRADQSAVEQEIKSWQMVQSFLDLCRKVEITVKEAHQKDIALHLEQSLKDAEAQQSIRKKRESVPQKPLSEVFAEELQSSFSGSTGTTPTTPSTSSSCLTGSNALAAHDELSHIQLGKIGGSAPALDAQLMIQSNPLLFKSPGLTSTRLNKVVRTWIHWQHEDQQEDGRNQVSEKHEPFRLSNWWRKVPVMVLSSAEERDEVLKARGESINSGSTKGMLVVDPEMSKQEMVDYIGSSLTRVQREYKETLRAASPASVSSDHPPSSPQSVHSPSAEAASYIERMRAKSFYTGRRNDNPPILLTHANEVETNKESTNKRLSFADELQYDGAIEGTHSPAGATAPSTVEGYSIYSNIKDGKVSIEHQIEINVVDLFDVQSNKEISLEEIMDGLRYVMEYRIKGGRFPSLEYDIMRRLADGLLMNMGNVEKKGTFRHALSEEADVAFQLFGEFLLEVQEFRQAVGEKPVSDLRHALKLDVRCGSGSTLQEQQSAVALIALLTSYYPQFSDWKELVKSEGQTAVQKCMREHADYVKAEKMPEMGGVILAPQALCFDRRIKRCLKMFRTSLETGLPSEAISALQEHYGKNILPQPPRTSIFKMLLTQFTDFMILLLLAVAILMGATKEFIPMTVLLIVVVLNAIIGFTQEYKAGKALDALTKLSVPMAQVLRDGATSMINSEELVPGDIVILEEGESVPADLRLAEVSQLEIIESILTGESVAVSKDPKEIKTLTRKLPLGDCKGNAFMSTVVAKGRGKGIVVRTGRLTEMGKISAAITGHTKALTPVQRKLALLGKLLVIFAIVLCAVMAAIKIGGYHHPTGESLKVALSLAVSVIPEGLVAVVTVTMALGVRRMAERKAIVRTLPAVETLGSVSYICSDKTGTLTEGKMGAAELWTSDGVTYGFTESTSLDPNKGDVTLKTTASPGETPQVLGKTLDKVPAQMLISLMVSSLCNNSSVVRKESDDDMQKTTVPLPVDPAENGYVKDLRDGSDMVEWKGIGDPTEVALVVAAQKAGFPKSFFHDLGYSRIFEQAFDSERKVMSVVYKAPLDNYQQQHFEFVLAKGAPEEILNRCIAHLPHFAPGSVASPLDILKPSEKEVSQPITEEIYDYVSQAAGRMADEGLRVLGLAYKKVKVNGGGASNDDGVVGDGLDDVIRVKNQKEAAPSTYKPTDVDLMTAANVAAHGDDDEEEEIPPGYAENDLVFLGLIGLIDPARPGVKESVRICKEAGITVVMITGDHIKTASAIAKELGILEVGGRAIKGEELDLLSEQGIAELRPFPNVFARVSPDNKLKLVTALQSRGASVAMTGDGVNDAPAIKAANVGVAMGIAGTDITKQAADIVLANDNFNTIVEAVQEGRRVFDNILKFIVYLLSCNCAEIFLFVLCSSVNYDLPFTVTMILWANIIADVPPAMALGVEPAEPGLMSRDPRSQKRGILTPTSIGIIIFQSLSMTLLTFGVYAWADRSEEHLAYAHSEAFAFLTTLQLLQGFLSRTMRTSVFRTNILGNRWMIYGVLVSFVLMIIGIYTPGFNRVLDLVPVNGITWAKIAVGCVIQTTLSEMEKLVLRHTGWTI